MTNLMQWFKKTFEPIGIDVGAFGARMIQLRIENQTPKVIAAARCSWDEETLGKIEKGQTPSPALIGAQLRRMASQGQFKGREAVIALPREIVQIKNFRLPTMPQEELAVAAEHEARALFLALDDLATIRALPAGEVRQGSDIRHEVIAVCVKRAATDLLVEQWHDAGFRPVGFDFDVCALYRSIERFVRRRDDEAEVNVLIEIGHRRTLVLIGRGRELNFCKSFEIGGAMLTNAIARKLGISLLDASTLRRRLSETYEQSQAIGNDPVRQTVIDTIRPIVEEIAREVSLCLRYYSVNFRGQRPSRVRVVGGESSDQSVLALLTKAMPVPVEAGRTIANADLSQMKAADRTDAMGDWSMAFGLALKFSSGSFADRLGVPRSAMRPNSVVTASDANSTTVVEPAIEIVEPAADTGESQHA